MHLCAYMDSGEDTDSEAPSLLSFTLRYVSLAELDALCRVGFREKLNRYLFIINGGSESYRQNL